MQNHLIQIVSSQHMKEFSFQKKKIKFSFFFSFKEYYVIEVRRTGSRYNNVNFVRCIFVYFLTPLEQANLSLNDVIQLKVQKIAPNYDQAKISAVNQFKKINFLFNKTNF